MSSEVKRFKVGQTVIIREVVYDAHFIFLKCEATIVHIRARPSEPVSAWLEILARGGGVVRIELPVSCIRKLANPNIASNWSRGIWRPSDIGSGD